MQSPVVDVMDIAENIKTKGSTANTQFFFDIGHLRDAVDKFRSAITKKALECRLCR